MQAGSFRPTTRRFLPTADRQIASTGQTQPHNILMLRKVDPLPAGDIQPQGTLAYGMLRRSQNAINMKVAEINESVTLPDGEETLLNLPVGLLGFESIKHYLLISHPEEEPFLWLRVKEDPNLAFLVISPFVILPDYEPEIGPDDVAFLELLSPGDALIYNIVTLHRDGHATVNLKGPIVINRHSRIAKQVILVNAAHYAVQHPIPHGEPGAS